MKKKFNNACEQLTVSREDSGELVYKNARGEIHREDGPAVEHPDGAKEWRRHGKLHREDGPAFETADGSKYWHFNGQYHREDGPAIEISGGIEYWWRHGKPWPEGAQTAAEKNNKKQEDLRRKQYKEIEDVCRNGLPYDLKIQGPLTLKKNRR